MRSTTVLAGALGEGWVLAPERHLGRPARARGPTLGDLVRLSNDRVLPRAIEDEGYLVLDTTHLKDGLIDVRSAARATAPPKSPKRRLAAGDLVVSRLRPYLRQIALVHPGAIALGGGRPLAGSTELLVLSPRREGESLAYLLPWLLSGEVQQALADAQEGGHHPRVAEDTLLGLRVGRAAASAVAASRAVERAISRVYDALADLEALAPVKPGSRNGPRAKSTARQR